MLFWIDLVFLTISAAAGIGSGYWLKHWSLRRQLTNVEASRNAKSAAESQRTKEIMGRLHDLAVNVAARVGEHNTRVREINTELSVEKGAAGQRNDGRHQIDGGQLENAARIGFGGTQTRGPATRN